MKLSVKLDTEWHLRSIHTARQTRQDGPVCVVSGVTVTVWIERLLLTCSDFTFSVGDSLELSDIQFKPPKRTRHRQHSLVVSGVAVWISFYTDVILFATVLHSGSVAEWLACCTQAQKARVQIAVATLSGNSLKQTVHTHCASVHQAAKLVAALLRVVRVTAGLAESNGSLPTGIWLTSHAGWLPRTGISSGTLRSVIEYGPPFFTTESHCTCRRGQQSDATARRRSQVMSTPFDRRPRQFITVSVQFRGVWRSASRGPSLQYVFFFFFSTTRTDVCRLHKGRLRLLTDSYMCIGVTRHETHLLRLVIAPLSVSLTRYSVPGQSL